MQHLIDKDALLAEIEKLYNGEIDTYTRDILGRLKSNIDTLEVKEVDLEKEIKDYFNNQPIVARSNGVDYQLIPSGESIAKHFFELGIRAQKL